MSVGAPSPEAGALVASVGVAAFGAVWLVAQVSAAISACLLRRRTDDRRQCVRAACRSGARGVRMSIRAGATQFGYPLGAAIGGAALAAGDYTGMGAVLSALFALAIVPHVLAGAEGLGKVPALASQPGA